MYDVSLWFYKHFLSLYDIEVVYYVDHTSLGSTIV
jgi:hypothetical protein